MINLPLHNKIQDVLFNRRKIVHSENVSRRIDLGINDNDQIIFFYTNYIEILYQKCEIPYLLDFFCTPILKLRKVERFEFRYRKMSSNVEKLRRRDSKTPESGLFY